MMTMLLLDQQKYVACRSLLRRHLQHCRPSSTSFLFHPPLVVAAAAVKVIVVVAVAVVILLVTFSFACLARP